jgi:hypothetical protein
VRGGGGLLDGAGGTGVGTQVDHPGTWDDARGPRQDRHTGPPGGGTRGRGHGGVIHGHLVQDGVIVIRIARGRVDDQH